MFNLNLFSKKIALAGALAFAALLPLPANAAGGDVDLSSGESLLNPTPVRAEAPSLMPIPTPAASVPLASPKIEPTLAQGKQDTNYDQAKEILSKTKVITNTTTTNQITKKISTTATDSKVTTNSLGKDDREKLSAIANNLKNTYNANRQAYTEKMTQCNGMTGDAKANCQKEAEAVKQKADESYQQYKNLSTYAQGDSKLATGNLREARNEMAAAAAERDRAKEASDKAGETLQAALAKCRDEHASLLQNKARKNCEAEAQAAYEATSANLKAAQARYDNASAALASAQENYDETQSAAKEEQTELRRQRQQDTGLFLGEDRPGMEYRAIGGNYLSTAEDVNPGTNIFKNITKRAFIFLVGIKPIVYTFAGFGLIAFAWMAIFNKLSWKWFANIAIGLFLVANMGRFIEYFVFKNQGVEIETQKLAFGDYLTTGMADTKYEWVEESATYIPPKFVQDEIPATVVNENVLNKTRGFCGKTTGATGWSNFTSCVKDIVSTGQKAVQAAQTAKNTVDNVKAGVNQIKYAAQNIGDAASQIKGGGISGFINAVGEIGSNAGAMVNVSGGMVNSTINNAGKIANNVQDLGMSSDAQREVGGIRASGQATNKVNDLIKNNDTMKTITATSSDLVDKSRESTALLKSATRTAAKGAKLVEDTTGATNRRNQRNQQRAKAKVEAANQQRQQQEQAIKDQNLVNKFQQKVQQEENKKTSQTDIAKSAVEQAQKASAKAQSTAKEAAQKTAEAQKAETVYNQKQQTAADAEARALLAEQQAANSGSEADKKKAERARQQADLAKAEANASQVAMNQAKIAAENAKAAAEEAAKPVADLTAKAREEAAKEAARVAEEAKQQAAQDLTDAEKEVAAKSQKAAEQQAAATQAYEEAKAKGDAATIRAAEAAKAKADAAAEELKQARLALENQKKQKLEAEQKAAAAELFQKQVEAGTYIMTADEKKQQAEEKLAEELREQHLNRSNPVKQAEYTQTRADRADEEARTAAAEANSKQKQADDLIRQAQAAQARAAQTNNPVDQRLAEQLGRRAELAAQEASEAKEKVLTAKVPAVKAQKVATNAAIIESQYLQETNQQKLAQYDQGIEQARASAKQKSEAAAAAQEEAQRLVQIAAAENDTASILAANEASRKAREAQAEALKAQALIDEQIRARKQAELDYYAARTREAELNQKKLDDAAQLEAYLKSLPAAERARLEQLLSESSNY